MRRLILVPALVALLVVAAPASASTLSWRGYEWHVFDGAGHLGQHWQASHTSIVSGHVEQVASGGVAGGVGISTPTFLYGEFSVRFRMTPGAGSKYVFLLCGHAQMQGACRPEIDFAEDSKADPYRSETTATLHYADAAGSNHMIHLATQHHDFARWHSVGVSWRSGVLRFFLDGHQWGEITGSHVPDTPMGFKFQTLSFGAGPAATLIVSVVRLRPQRVVR